ncbi:MAG: DUF2806 domain-containing protein [Oscillospiraceae bacterium]|nr:DUF2806 domain-containing protein [Oscillospiraceae bacterium]
MSGAKGVEIHDIFGASQPLTKLIETAGQAIGEWYKPIGVKRMAKAKTAELQIIGEALGDNIHLPTKYDDGKLTMSTQDFEELAKRTGNRLMYQELRKQQNIESIVELAGAELEKEETVSDEPVDPDWTIRFFNSVEDVSNEEMQKLWGRVLAGEVKRPESFSIRTLEILKNMSQAEAMIFQKLASYCLVTRKDICLSSDTNLLREHGLAYIDILNTEDCGLLQSQSGMVLIMNFKNESSFYIHNKSVLGHISPANEETKRFDLPVYRLTGSGEELYNIIKSSPNNSYFLDFWKHIRKKEKNLKVSVHKIEAFYYDGRAKYFPPDILPPQDDHTEVTS